MEPFHSPLDSVVIPLDRPNVDTDAIIPKQLMKSIRRTGFGDNLFDEWRYLDRGEPGQDASERPRNPDFPLNQSRFHGAKVLLARDNFECGSSREHAVWALRDFGIRALVAPSFADIFFNNCFKNGLLPVAVDELFSMADATQGLQVTINLEAESLTAEGGAQIPFCHRRRAQAAPAHGIGRHSLTLQCAELIRAFESRRRAAEPWLFTGSRPEETSMKSVTRHTFLVATDTSRKP